MSRHVYNAASLTGFIGRRIMSRFRREPVYSESVPSGDDRLSDKPRSVFLRHLDCGSCNACEMELVALGNPFYDSERFGIKFEASPLHADALVLTGVFTRNLAEAAELTLAAMSEPKRIVTVGDCAADGGIFKGSYALASRPPQVENAIVGHVAGCPPAPADILRALGDIEWVPKED
jgi:Ni,Fe-hydrogenase III small subunit